MLTDVLDNKREFERLVFQHRQLLLFAKISLKVAHINVTCLKTQRALKTFENAFVRDTHATTFSEGVKPLMIVVCFQLLSTQLSHSYQQYLLIKTSVAVSANAGKWNIVCEEGGVGEGRSRYVISPGGGNFECMSCKGRGWGGLNFCWVYAACVSEPLPLYI